MTEFDTAWTDKDAYVDQSDEDANFGSDTQLHVRSFEGTLGGGANQRAYVGFNLDDLSLPDDVADRLIEALVRFPVNENSDEDRTLELYEIAPADWTEAGVTWTNQPAAGDLQDTEDSGSIANDLHAWTINELFLQALEENRSRLGFVARDQDEGASLAQQQDYDSREGGDSTLGEDEPELQIIYKSAAEADLAATVEPRFRETMSSSVQPAFPRAEDLGSLIDVVLASELTSIAAVQAVPIRGDHLGRATGRVSITLGGVLEDVQTVFDEAGTTVTVDGDEVTAIVQLVDAFDEPYPTVRAGDPAGLSRGDARLFALGDGSTFEVGAVVTWQGIRFRVVGVLDEEQITGEAMYREVGLRRLATRHEGRAIGTVNAS